MTLIKREDAIEAVKHSTAYMHDDLYEAISRIPSAEATGALDEAIAKYVADGYMLPLSGDLISRADAIGAVYRYFAEEFNNEPYETDEDGDEVFTDMKSVNKLLAHNKAVSKAIKALPSAEAEWIPCSERLPAMGDYVLTYRPSLAMRMVVDSYEEYYGEDDNEWHAEWVYGEDKVVAWMPLPMPYREDGEV